MQNPLRRRRTLIAVAATVAIGAGGLGAAGPSRAAAPGPGPAEDCATAVAIDGLARGTQLHGLTVTQGTEPEEFDAQVIGTLTDGVAPGVPMVLVRVDPKTLDVDAGEVHGIWEGMSGSPVYADAGHTQLVGAVAYGMASEASWVAGLTPYSAMSDYLGTSGAPVRSRAATRLDARTARMVATAARVSTATAATGFRVLPTPRGVAGVSPALIALAARKAARYPWLAAGQAPLGKMAAGAAADPAETLVAGGNLAASASYGDVVMGSVGTVTSVCDGDLVGFGHPMNLTGDATLSLHPAEALYVQGDATPFKVANIGPAVGTVFGDHLTGITGTVGALPATTLVRSTATYGSRSRTGASYVSVRDADTIATTTMYENLNNQTVVLDGQFKGSALMSWSMAGTVSGKPFRLTHADRYLATDSGVPADLAFGVGSLTYQVASMPGVTLDSVTTSTTATKDVSAFSLVRVEQRRRGAWVSLTARQPGLVRAGGKLVLRAVIRRPGQIATIPFSFAVPRAARGRMAGLLVAGGSELGLDLGDSVASARTALTHAVRGDAVAAQFGRIIDVPGQDEEEDEDYDRAAARRAGPKGGPRLVRFVHRASSAPMPAVVSGYRMVPVLVR